VADEERKSEQPAEDQPTHGAVDPEDVVDPVASEAEAGADESDEPKNRRARRAAASQARKHRLRERREAEAIGLDTQEILDDALVRSTDTAGKWLRNNSSKIQWAIVIGIVGWAGWGLYGWQVAASQAAASDALAAAVVAERGRIGDPAEQGKVNEQRVIDPTPIFADHATRQVAAYNQFESAAKLRPESGTGHYAQLARASVLLDQGKFDDAISAYETLERSEFAKSDPELRGRSIEGAAIAQEGKGDKAAALETYKRLVASEIASFMELAMYQQARLQRDTGDTAGAKETLSKLQEELGGLDDALGVSSSYTKSGVKLLRDALGMESAEPAPQKSNPITPEQLEALQKQVQDQIDQASKNAKKEPAPTGDEPVPDAPPPVRDTPASAEKQAPPAPLPAPTPAPTPEQ
jgi:predicted negative regulator of RcsB-dependent stress response